ncbi:hypothetical protein [Streptomyces sp. CAU 1734]|uniref:hypothetical protein n=1 Tax=Streptomyces sp. CAU 1734 TaxID=3140360 RepID=UPI003260923A
MSAPPVAMPDAVAIGCGYLRAALLARGTTAPVGTRVPDPRPIRFVRIERLPGVQLTVVHDRPRLDVHCWGADEADAAALAAECRAILGAARGTFGATVLARPRTGGPGWLPDPVSGQARYAFTWDITLRGTPL